MKFNRRKMQIPVPGGNNPRHQYMLGSDSLESFAEKELEVQVDTKLNMSQQYSFAAKKANSIWTMLGRMLPAG